ncbi:MAG: hypothetical protein IAA97_06080 [Spirochaetes bacterium]|uniref:Uncharacterized protein n=1 Tax=Candidatus Ornithospirochaeta stercoripullorum TaxID=2840899 RepID=A0A9D9E3P9_9SPIO|nr:hypothetical protein [Candidatus Ornithospirochaeta stercoripullorum]
MHDVSDLVIEAVANSIEAGAERIAVSIAIADGVVNARISDNGVFTLEGNPFREGITTKGEGRGQGLHIIYKRSEGRCRLTRGDGITELEFSAEDDGSFDELDKALLPLLGMDDGITVKIRKNNREMEITRSLLEKWDAVPDRAGRIGRFRALIHSLEKGEIYG